MFVFVRVPGAEWKTKWSPAWQGGNGSEENQTSWLLQQTGELGRSKGRRGPLGGYFVDSC